MTTKCPTCGHDPRQSERTYRAKLAQAGLPLPDSESKRRGRSMPGVRGTVPRHTERDAQIAAAVASGRRVRDVAAELGITPAAAWHGLRAHRQRSA